MQIYRVFTFRQFGDAGYFSLLKSPVFAGWYSIDSDLWDHFKLYFA